MLRSLPVPVLMSVICWVGAGVNYLLFHTLAELFSIVMTVQGGPTLFGLPAFGFLVHRSVKTFT